MQTLRFTIWTMTAGYTAVTIVLMCFISGCAGHEAMIWRKIEPPRQQCAIVVCESRMGRIDPKRDCTKCADSIGDIL